MDRDLPHMGRLSALVEDLRSVLYPVHCLGCDAPGDWACAACLRELPLFSAPQTAPLLPSGRVPTVPSVFAVCAYAEPLWQGLIRVLKYEAIEGVAVPLGEVLARFRTGMTPWWPAGMGDGWTLIPLPTEPEHIRERGGDHMEIWRHLWRELLPDVIDGRGLIHRRQGAGAQAARQTKGAREQAMAGRFLIRPCTDARIILLDDVYTTGSTIQAAAAACMEAGAKEIVVLVAAFSGGRADRAKV